MSEGRLVYSTESGRICPRCEKPADRCRCKKNKKPATTAPKVDGIIRIQREVKGRRGKTVTTVSGFAEGAPELKKIAAKLKNRCGTGGSSKNDVIIIQGDHRQVILGELERMGYRAKLTGG